MQACFMIHLVIIGVNQVSWKCYNNKHWIVLNFRRQRSATGEQRHLEGEPGSEAAV